MGGQIAASSLEAGKRLEAADEITSFLQRIGKNFL
jgi:hypothetical protein